MVVSLSIGKAHGNTPGQQYPLMKWSRLSQACLSYSMKGYALDERYARDVIIGDADAIISNSLQTKKQRRVFIQRI
jgi:predicted  nucleic acid-binding Zn ribbon protein